MADLSTDSSPSLTLPGTIAIPSLAPVYVDGIPVASVTPQQPPPADTQRFWSSELRMPGDPDVENLVVDLAKPKLVNYFSLDVPHFPHNLHFYYWDGQAWQHILRQNGTPLVIRTGGSVPVLVNNPAAVAAGMNPYHYGAGHWVHHDEQVTPFTSSRIRLAGRRHKIDSAPGTSFPVGPDGSLHAYPLGARNLDFGLRITSRGDAPCQPRSPSVITERQPFYDSDDVNGSPMTVALRENRAADLLQGATWRCSPQVASAAVVNLYVDSRDEDGNAQVIDQFYVNPVTSGVKFNLYYSPVPPPGAPPQGLDDPLLFPVTAFSGSQVPVAGPAGLLFPDTPGWVTLSNQGSGVASGSPWWVALQLSPQFGSGDGGSYMILDAGLFQIYFASGSWQVTLAAPESGTLADWTFDFATGDALTFIVGYDGARFFAWNPRATMEQVAAGPAVQSASLLRFGASLTAETEMSPWPGNYLLGDFVLKQTLADVTDGVPQDFLDFAADASAYVSPLPCQQAPSTAGAVARFDGSFVLGTVNPGGFVGGLGSAYEACAWTPILRDFSLAKGFVDFEPQLAAVFRFEFTQLQPQPFDWFLPGPVTTQLFIDQSVPGDVATAPAVLEPGMTVTAAAATSVTYSDAPAPTTPAPAGAALPTEALYVVDPALATQVAQSQGSLYNFQQWQQTALAPRQATAGPSAYTQTQLPVTSRVAYFVAISALTMYRTDPTVPDDTARYLETFGDTANLDPGSMSAAGAWQWQPGALMSPPNIAGSALVQSVAFSSAHPVTGIQFAATQSDAVQLLEDPGFADITLQTWAAAGDAQPLTIAPVNAQLGNMVQVSRVAGAYGWSYVMQTWPTWDVLMAQNPTWATLQASGSSSVYGGMTYNGDPVLTTEAGRLYVAARVFAPQTLNAPLSLQLIDGPTGAVIAEADQVVNGGTVTEWFTGYTIGETVYSTVTWSTMMGDYSTWLAIEEQGQLASQLQYFDFETGTEGFTGTNATVAQSSAWASSGTYSLLLTATSAAAGAGHWDAASPLFPVTPGQLYGATAVAYSAAGVGEAQVGVNWYDASMTYISSVFAAGVAAPAATPTPVSTVGATAPSNAVFASLVVGDGEGSSTGTQVAFDDVSLYLVTGPEWATIDVTQSPPGKSITAQLIQKTSTSDTWFVDDLSVFEDSLVWSFSSDGGASWWPAYDVRNNPSGAILFPPPAEGFGNQLMWRAQAYRPGLNISSLAIRPWYSVYPRGILPRTAGVGCGPNSLPLDHYNYIENDPMWQLSDSPIPESWYFAYRQKTGLTQGAAYPPADTALQGFTVGDALVYEEPFAEIEAEQTWEDFYTDIFTDYYGVPDGGDIYTDVYCDIYGATAAPGYGSGYNNNVQPSPALVLGMPQPASVHLSDSFSLSAAGEDIPAPTSQIGADLGAVAGGSGTVTSFVSLTGEPLAVRRLFLGNQIPASLSASLASADLGVRKVFFDFTPDATTTPEQLDAFLADCATHGLDAEVSLWAGIDMTSGSGTQWSIDGTHYYRDLMRAYVPVIRRNGYSHIWVASNAAIISGDVLIRGWYPGDDLVDGVSPTYYSNGIEPGCPGGQNLNVVAAFADLHAKPLGLAGFGVDHSKYTQTQGNDFLSYVKRFFAARVAAGKQDGDLIYTSTGSYALASAPGSWVTYYEQIGDEL